MLDDPTAEVGEPRVTRGVRGLGVGDDRVVHEMGDGPTPVRVQPEREDAEHVRLEVVHEEAADDVGVADAGPQQQPRGLERASPEDHVPGRHLPRRAVGVEVSHAARLASAGVEDDLGDVGLRADLAAAGAQRASQHRDRVALRLDRAAEEGAEAAVVARRAAVVLDAVHPGRRPVGVEAELGGGRRREPGAVHVGPGRHRVGAGPPGGVRVAGVVPGDADEALGGRVVRLELVVAERPVDEVGTFDGAELGAGVEVDLAKARELPVGVEPAAADRGRQVVHPAGVDPVALALAVTEGARLEERVGAEEVAGEALHLVVADVTARRVRGLEVEQVVRALLEHDHRPSRVGEDVGGGRPCGSGPDDDGVDVSHAAAGASQARRSTSVSEKPRGWTSPG